MISHDMKTILKDTSTSNLSVKIIHFGADFSCITDRLESYDRLQEDINEHVKNLLKQADVYMQCSEILKQRFYHDVKLNRDANKILEEEREDKLKEADF